MASLEVTRPARVLVVEDDPDLRENLAELLAASGYVVVTAENSVGALREIAAGGVDLLITDLRMPGPNGVDLINAAHRERSGLRAILMTAFEAGPPAEDLRGGTVRYLRKPFEAEEVTRLVARVLSSRGG